jgi:hypothetical protein
MRRENDMWDRVLASTRWLWLLAGVGLGCYLLFSGGSAPAPGGTAAQAASEHGANRLIARRTRTGTRNIEDLRVGDRVLARNPEISDEERATWEEPDWQNWRQVRLEMTKPDGGILHIEMLRPKFWFDENQVQPGGTVFLDLPEMGAEGDARVVSTGDCPPIAQGDGQVITATFAHPPSTKVLDVHFEGEPEPIGVTDNHRFWSEDRFEFLPIGQMEIGERVLTYYGDTRRIKQKLPRLSPEVVYNLEVHAENVYFVGSLGTLVHNLYGRNRYSRIAYSFRKKYGGLDSNYNVAVLEYVEGGEIKYMVARSGKYYGKKKGWNKVPLHAQYHSEQYLKRWAIKKWGSAKEAKKHIRKLYTERAPCSSDRIAKNCYNEIVKWLRSKVMSDLPQNTNVPQVIRNTKNLRESKRQFDVLPLDDYRW